MTHLHWAGRYASSDKPHSDGLEPHEQTKETKQLLVLCKGYLKFSLTYRGTINAKHTSLLLTGALPLCTF